MVWYITDNYLENDNLIKYVVEINILNNFLHVRIYLKTDFYLLDKW